MTEERLGQLESCGYIGRDDTAELVAEVRRLRKELMQSTVDAHRENMRIINSLADTRGVYADGSTVELREDIAAGRVSLEQAAKLGYTAPTVIELSQEGNPMAPRAMELTVQEHKMNGLRKCLEDQEALTQAIGRRLEDLMREKVDAADHNALVSRLGAAEDRHNRLYDEVEAIKWRASQVTQTYPPEEEAPLTPYGEELLARAGRFLVALKEWSAPVPTVLHEEFKSLLEALEDRA